MGNKVIAEEKNANSEKAPAKSRDSAVRICELGAVEAAPTFAGFVSFLLGIA